MNYDKIAKKLAKIHCPDALAGKILKLGFEEIGYGASATVYKKKKTVMKVFSSDPAYLVWLNFCYKNQGNPYVPELYSKVYELKNDTYVVFMECLTLNMKRAQHCDAYNCINMFDTCPEGNTALQVVLDDIWANGDLNDVHDENILFRGDQAVVTDPYAFGYTGQIETVDQSNIVKV